MLFLNKLGLLACGLLFLPGIAMADISLSMSQAEQYALENDALIKSHNEYSLAYKQESVASDQWPDPKIKFGFQSIPTDSFDLQQEPMTQIVIGYSQMVPRGDSLLYEAELMQARSAMELADMNLRQRQVRRAVRQAWLNVYLQDASEKIVKKNRNLFKQQLDVTQYLYSAGRNQQQDVLQAELELSLIDDRLLQIEAKKNEARALLARWTGLNVSNYELVLDGTLFEAVKTKNNIQLLEQVQKHPEIIKHNEKIIVSNKQVNLAEQKYKLGWGFEMNYGKRSGKNPDGSDRADLVTGMVNIDIPVFTEDRQDRVLAAKRMNLQASKYEKQDKLSYFEAEINQIYIRLEKLKTRLYLYDVKVLPQANQNAKAALNGYQSGVVTFFTLTRARSAELTAELQRLNLYNEQALAYVEMSFLVGEK